MVSEFQLEQMADRIDALEAKIEKMDLDIQNIKIYIKSGVPKESIEGMINNYFKEG